MSSTTTTENTTSVDNGQNQNQVIVPSAPTCSALNGISYQTLAGNQLIIAFNGNSQMSVHSSLAVFHLNWYWIPANGQAISTLQMQITNSMWANGHGQNFQLLHCIAERAIGHSAAD